MNDSTDKDTISDDITKRLDVTGALKILAVGLALLVALAFFSGWLDNRVEWLCDGVWIEKSDGSTECVEGAVP